MQLVAYGAQDIYLTGNPQITFFKVVYRRHTNFSMEAIEQTFNGSVGDSSRTSATISRNGDLVNRMYIQHTLHSTNVLNESAQDITSIELEIGGQRIDKHYGKWMEAWAELTENKTGREMGTNFQVMSGMGQGAVQNNACTAVDNATDATAVFFSMPTMDSRVVYTPLQFWFCRNPGLALPLIALQYHEVKVIIEWSTITAAGNDHKLWCDYIYLDTDERRRFAQVSHEYLIEQVQEQSITTGEVASDLNFNHPVKELIWVGGTWAGGASAATAITGGKKWHLKLNGHDRFAVRDYRYFTRAQVWQHHSGAGGLGVGGTENEFNDSIAVYSFAIKPEEHQPSGTCNFSRIDNAQLICTSGPDAAFVVFAVNYNVLRIMSGMGGLAYSN